MNNHAEIKKHSTIMLDNLAAMEELVKKFTPKTDEYDATMGDDISASAKNLMIQITKELSDLKKFVSQKTEGVKGFATKLGDAQRKNTRRIDSING